MYDCLIIKVDLCLLKSPRAKPALILCFSVMHLYSMSERNYANIVITIILANH